MNSDIAGSQKSPAGVSAHLRRVVNRESSSSNIFVSNLHWNQFDLRMKLTKPTKWSSLILLSHSKKLEGILIHKIPIPIQFIPCLHKIMGSPEGIETLAENQNVFILSRFTPNPSCWKMDGAIYSLDKSLSTGEVLSKPILTLHACTFFDVRLYFSLYPSLHRHRVLKSLQRRKINTWGTCRSQSLRFGFCILSVNLWRKIAKGKHSAQEPFEVRKLPKTCLQLLEILV